MPESGRYQFVAGRGDQNQTDTINRLGAEGYKVIQMVGIPTAVADMAPILVLMEKEESLKTR